MHRMQTKLCSYVSAQIYYAMDYIISVGLHVSILISLHAANLPFLPLLRPFCYLITTRNRRDTCNNATLIKTKHP